MIRVPHQEQLASGLSLLHERTASSSASLTWWVPAGGASELAAARGASIILAEAMLRGTAKLTGRQLTAELSRRGAIYSCWAGARFIVVRATLRASVLREVIPFLAAMVQEPRLDDRSILAARETCVQTAVSLLDDPSEMASRLFRKAMLLPPYDVGGYDSAEALGAVAPEAVRQHLATCVKPRGSVVSVVGPFEPAELADWISDATHSWKGFGPSLPRTRLAPPGTQSEHSATRSTYIELGLPTVSGTSPLMPAWVLASHALGEAASSRLFERLRNRKGLVYGVSSHQVGLDGTGFLRVSASCEAANTPRVLVAIREELAALMRRGLSPREHQSAVNGVLSSIVAHMEAPGPRALAMASDWTDFGKARSRAQLRRTVLGCTLDKVNAAIRQSLEFQPTIAIYGRGKSQGQP